MTTRPPPKLDGGIPIIKEGSAPSSGLRNQERPASICNARPSTAGSVSSKEQVSIGGRTSANVTSGEMQKPPSPHPSLARPPTRARNPAPLPQCKNNGFGNHKSTKFERCPNTYKTLQNNTNNSGSSRELPGVPGSSRELPGAPPDPHLHKAAFKLTFLSKELDKV